MPATLTQQPGQGPAPLSDGRRQTLRTLALQAMRFCGVGTAGMALYLGLYVVGQELMSVTVANVLAWLISTVVTNEVHRRVTFGVSTHDGAAADQMVSTISSIVALGISTVLLATIPTAGEFAQIALLVAVNAVVGAGRFGVMRWWLVDHRAAA